jgi:hypothetical protein
MRRPRPISLKTAEAIRTRLWPDFVERDGCVFVAFEVSDSTPAPPPGRKLSEWELFLNHTQLFHEFQSPAYEWILVDKTSPGLDVYEPQVHAEHPVFLLANQLGGTLARIWATKLKQDFPKDRFRIYYLNYDTCLRFHKVRAEDGVWRTDAQFLAANDPCFRDGIVYDTDYIERPVRRIDTKSAAS